MFTRIGDVLPRFKTYERLFSNHDQLIEALSKAYLDILKFCSDAKAVFRRGQRLSSTFSYGLYMYITRINKGYYGMCFLDTSLPLCSCNMTASGDLYAFDMEL